MRTIAALVLAATLPASVASAQEGRNEPAAIAARVLAEKAWVADADRCPSEVMLQSKPLAHIGQRCSTDALAKCLSECQSGVATACYWLAQDLQGAQVDRLAYDVLFQRSCRLGVMSGCTNRAAGMLATGPDDEACQHGMQLKKELLEKQAAPKTDR